MLVQQEDLDSTQKQNKTNKRKNQEAYTGIMSEALMYSS